jgi:hypothetical protein
MKSTKYQLLKDDFDHVCEQLHLKNELIIQLRIEIKGLKHQLVELDKNRDFWLEEHDKTSMELQQANEQKEKMTRLYKIFNDKYEWALGEIGRLKGKQ